MYHKDSQPTDLSCFDIHGDNIVECERTLALIMAAFEGKIARVDGPLDSAACPSFILKLSDSGHSLKLTFLPGYGRWNQDIISFVGDLGGLLRESSDAILTQITGTSEKPLIAIEYCAALQAGNQAWQRNGRAYSFALARIPYVYITELGGYELGSDRSRRASRVPNPAVPFSYLSSSLSLNTLVLPVLIPNPGASPTMIGKYKNLFGFQDLLYILRSLVLGQVYQEARESLELKALQFVQQLASGRRQNDTLTPEQWAEAYRYIKGGGTLVQYVRRITSMNWQKTAYISGLTATAAELMTISSQYAIGLTSSNLPICLVAANKRNSFVDAVRELYPYLPNAFMEWLSRPGDLTICWIMGFKPRGDDARPDRGLGPMSRMLIGEKSDLLTVVYGPAPASMCSQLENDPIGLMTANGLWEAVMKVSDALLIDCSTIQDRKARGYVRSHWIAGIPTKRASSLSILPRPLRIGEHDVDGALHLFFTRSGSPSVFEGMCNPPGGDWSGLSLQIPDRSLELRWLSLPRVTRPDAKRPDHVFQIFDISDYPVALIVESKEQLSSIGHDTGPRLVKYVKELSATSPTVQRKGQSDVWVHATKMLPIDSVRFASAAAFIMNSVADLTTARRNAAADLVLGLQFTEGGTDCCIYMRPYTELGQSIAEFMKGIAGHCPNITVRLA